MESSSVSRMSSKKDDWLRMLSDSPGNVGSAARFPRAARLVENGEAVVRRLALLADAHQRRGGACFVACSVARRQRVAVQPGHKIGEGSEARQDGAAGGGVVEGGQQAAV